MELKHHLFLCLQIKYLSTVNWELWLLVTRREVSCPVPLDNKLHEAIFLSEENLNLIQFIDSAPDMKQTQRPDGNGKLYQRHTVSRIFTPQTSTENIEVKKI